MLTQIFNYLREKILKKTYTPIWDEHCRKLFKEFKVTPDHNSADNLIIALNENIHNKWYETTANLSFTHSSRQA